MSSLRRLKTFAVLEEKPPEPSLAPASPVVIVERTPEAFFQSIRQSLESWPNPLVNGSGRVTYRLEGPWFLLEPQRHPLRGSRKYYAGWERAMRKDHNLEADVFIPPDLKPGPREQRWQELVRRYLKDKPATRIDGKKNEAWKVLRAFCEQHGLKCGLQIYPAATCIVEVEVKFANAFSNTVQPLPWMYGTYGGSQSNLEPLPKYQGFVFPAFASSPRHKRSLCETVNRYGYGAETLVVLYRQWENSSSMGRKVKRLRVHVQKQWVPKLERTLRRVRRKPSERVHTPTEAYGSQAPLLKESFGSPGELWETLREAEYKVFCKPGLYRRIGQSPEAEAAWEEAVRKQVENRRRQMSRDESTEKGEKARNN